MYAVGAALLLALAAGVGAIAALTLGSDEAPREGASSTEPAGETNPERAGDANAAGSGRTEETLRQGDIDGSDEAEYLDEVAEVQNGAVEASLRSNNRLLRYDGLSADDVEIMKADSAALASFDRRAEDLDPPSEYEDQYEVFVLAINELRDANELAYRLAADPASARQADFEAYDEHIDSATSHLERSNEILGRDYETTEAAREVSLG